MIPNLITSKAITLQIEGRPHMVNADSPNYPLVRKAIAEERWDDIYDLISVRTVVNKLTDGEVEIIDDQIFYQGHEVHGAVVDKILELLREGFNITPLSRFLARVQNNPSITARQELYLFCEANGFMIDEDGFLIAYKAVRYDYKDKYTGTMDNSVGKTLSMDRTLVDPSRARTCSAGLHFATFDYAANIYGNVGREGSDRLMVVRVDPADVVAIPNDYNNQKGRAWKYISVDEIVDKAPLKKKTFTNKDFQVKPTQTTTPAPAVDYNAGDVAKIKAALAKANGRIAGYGGAASILGIPESTLRGRMKRLSIK